MNVQVGDQGCLHIPVAAVYPQHPAIPLSLGLGDVVENNETEALYILAYSGGCSLVAINLNTGNRLTQAPVRYLDGTCLTRDEALAVLGDGGLSSWTLVRRGCDR